jgi:outer membrane protein TolC
MSEMARSSYELFENARSDLFFDVKTAYYNYYFIERAIEITLENMEILKIFKNLSLVKIEAGSASLVDELRVELELNDLENQLALFLDSRDVFRTQFNNLLNRDNTVLIEVPRELKEEELPFDQLSLLDSILTSNREMRSLDFKLESFRRQEDVAQKLGLPKFNVGMNYLVIGENSASADPDNGEDAFVFPSIGLSLPIYRKKYKAMIREAEYMKEAVISEKEHKRNSLSTLLQENIKDFNDSDRRLSLNERQSEIANKVLDILITSYSTNSNEFEEVLRIERQLLGYKLAKERALIDKNVSVAFINYLLGN